jgi:hypothetical protein
MDFEDFEEVEMNPSTESHSCDDIGMNGGCGYDCPLFRDGECCIQEEMIESLIKSLQEAEALLKERKIEMEKKKLTLFCKCGQRAMDDTWLCADCRTVALISPDMMKIDDVIRGKR